MNLYCFCQKKIDDFASVMLNGASLHLLSAFQKKIKNKINIEKTIF